MSTVEELEAAVQRLSPEDRAAFRAWFAEFDANEWDRQLESDVVAGRLDWLAAEALADRSAGRCTDR
jgi:outer membrane murein-binding lipoprotein Lpp